MPFSQSRIDELQRGIRSALSSTTLGDRDRTFLQDMQARIDRYGRRTRFSDKQYERLMRLTSTPRAQAQRRSMPGSQWRRPPRARRGRGSPLWSAVIIAGILGVLGYTAIERFPERLGPAVELTAIETVAGRVTRVRDGDTIEVAGVPIRFGSLDCAESGTAAGEKATRHMRRLVSGQRLTCHLNGRSSHDRKIGSCRMPDGRDVAGVMIREGYCGRFW